jgi:hypothetical protein
VHARLDDLVIALYVTIDELLEPRRGPGRPPKLADSELVCLDAYESFGLGQFRCDSMGVEDGTK